MKDFEDVDNPFSNVNWMMNLDGHTSLGLFLNGHASSVFFRLNKGRWLVRVGAVTRRDVENSGPSCFKAPQLAFMLAALMIGDHFSISYR